RRMQLQPALLPRTEVEGLFMAPPAQVPHVYVASVLAAQQKLRVQPAFNHVGSSPLAGQHHIVAQVPPEVVGEELRTAVDLPTAKNVKREMVKHQHASRPIPAWRTETAD